MGEERGQRGGEAPEDASPGITYAIMLRKGGAGLQAVEEVAIVGHWHTNTMGMHDERLVKMKQFVMNGKGTRAINMSVGDPTEFDQKSYGKTSEKKENPGNRNNFRRFGL